MQRSEKIEFAPLYPKPHRLEIGSEGAIAIPERNRGTDDCHGG